MDSEGQLIRLPSALLYARGATASSPAAGRAFEHAAALPLPGGVPYQAVAIDSSNRALAIRAMLALCSLAGCGPPDPQRVVCPEDEALLWYCDHRRGCCAYPCGYVGQGDCTGVSPLLTCVFPRGVSGTEPGYSIRCIDGGEVLRPWPEDARMSIDLTTDGRLDFAVAPSDGGVDAPPGDGPRDASFDARRDGAAPDGPLDASIHDLRLGG